jgi:prevent-host-death family protein
MSRCVPIRELKNTARFSHLVEESGEPVWVTKNGYDHLVVMTATAYRAFSNQIAEAKLLAAISQAESDIACGKLIDGHQHLAELREKYGY